MSATALNLVTPLQATQIPACARMLARAFHTDPYFEHVFPNAQARLRAPAWIFARILAYGIRYGAAHVANGADGSAVWLTPEHPDPTFAGLIRTGFAYAPLVAGLPATRRMIAMNTCAEHLRKQVMVEPHWYLFNLGVDPRQQGTGVGGALLAPILARADANNTPCYLETSNPANPNFYRKHGFEVVQTAIPGGGGPRMYGMRRNAQAARASL